MNLWIIAAIVIGLLVIAGVALISTGAVQVQAEKKITSCATCGGQCTKDNNCGSPTCGAANGGTCTCDKK